MFYFSRDITIRLSMEDILITCGKAQSYDWSGSILESTSHVVSVEKQNEEEYTIVIMLKTILKIISLNQIILQVLVLM